MNFTDPTVDTLILCHPVLLSNQKAPKGCKLLSMKLFFILLLLSGAVDRESLRFAYSTEQGYDTSCGLTTLACFMDRYWGVSSDEFSLAREFLAGKIAGGDFTVSFADMAAILKAKGFAYKAYQMSYDQLEKAVAKYAPIIVHYDKPEGHFALVLAIRGDAVLTADPAEGTISRERASFESRWSGKVLVAALPGKESRRGFSRRSEIIGLGAGRAAGKGGSRGSRSLAMVKTMKRTISTVVVLVLAMSGSMSAQTTTHQRLGVVGKDSLDVTVGTTFEILRSDTSVNAGVEIDPSISLDLLFRQRFGLSFELPGLSGSPWGATRSRAPSAR